MSDGRVWFGRMSASESGDAFLATTGPQKVRRRLLRRILLTLVTQYACVPTGAIAADAQAYADPLIILRQTQVRARVRNGNEWSARSSIDLGTQC